MTPKGIHPVIPPKGIPISLSEPQSEQFIVQFSTEPMPAEEPVLWALADTDDGSIPLSPIKDQAKEVEAKPKEGAPYLMHKVGKQVWFRGFIAVANVSALLQAYQNYTEQYRENPHRDVFVNDRASAIYDPQKFISRPFAKVLLPKDHQADSSEESRLLALRARGMKNRARFARLMIISNVGRTAGDAAAVWGECVGGEAECDWKPTSVSVLDAGVAIPWMVSGQLNKKASNFISDAAKKGMEKQAMQAAERKAYQLFRNGQQFLFVANVFQVGAGGLQMYIEWKNLREGGEEHLPAFVDGAADTGRAAAYSAYNVFLIRACPHKVVNG